MSETGNNNNNILKEVNSMVPFIASMIMTARDDYGLEAGQAKYRLYFVTNTTRFGKYQNDVNFILINDGYENCIVIE
jgi:hypothetical protein